MKILADKKNLNARAFFLFKILAPIIVQIPKKHSTKVHYDTRTFSFKDGMENLPILM